MPQLVLKIIFMGLECLQPSGIRPERISVSRLLDKSTGSKAKKLFPVACSAPGPLLGVRDTRMDAHWGRSSMSPSSPHPNPPPPRSPRGSLLLPVLLALCHGSAPGLNFTLEDLAIPLERELPGASRPCPLFLSPAPVAAHLGSGSESPLAWTELTSRLLDFAHRRSAKVTDAAMNHSRHTLVPELWVSVSVPSETPARGLGACLCPVSCLLFCSSTQQ